ncbi:MAG: two-component system sensor histidine kinase NtrB [Planctomycetota bacterium]
MAPESDRRSRAYLIFRLFIIATGFALVTVYQISPGRADGERAFRFLFGLLCFYLFAALALLVTYPRWRAQRLAVKAQILLDLAIQALLIWGTGGALSVFSPLLLVTLVSATSLVSGRGAFALATCAAGLLVFATLGTALRALPPGSPERLAGFPLGRDRTLLWSHLAGSIMAFYAASALGARFSHGLRSVQGIQGEILENMAEGLLAVDAKGIVCQANREARKLVSFPEPRRRRSGVSLDTLFPLPEHAELRRAFESGQRRTLVVSIEGPGGRKRPVEVKVSSANGEGEGPRYRIAILSDLTLKREIEAAERRIQKLEELQVMAFGIAHEIRNPLASIRGCVQEISRLRRDDPGTAAYADIVLRESDRLDGMLEDFLRYARMGPADLAPLDLGEVVEEAAFLLRSRSDLGRREVAVESSPRRFRIFGHRNSLIQVFLNLGLNALEATRPEDGRIVFAIRESAAAPSAPRMGADLEEAPGVEVTVADNGVGIPDAQRRHLFTPFFSTKPAGGGLGLCLVERIVRDHLGTVDFSSEVSSGSVFRVWFPAMRQRGAEEPEPAPESEICEFEETALIEAVESP